MSHVDLDSCIQQCESCAATCTDTLNQCLEKGGRHAEAAHLRLLMDCIQICRTSADFMRRRSELHMHVCRACAEVCLRCAESCEGMEGDFMKRCAEACRACARSCQEMAGARA